MDRKTDIGGGYFLMRDSFCCWVISEKPTKSGKIRQKRVSGYCATVEEALTSLLNSHTREIDARSIKVLIKEIIALKSAVREWAKAIEGGQK